MSNQENLNAAHLAKLQPAFALQIRVFLAIASVFGWLPIITSSLRTAAQQNAFHLTNPTKIPAAGKGGAHELGRAIDLNFVKNGSQLRFSSGRDGWLSSGLIAVSKLCGLRWGGNFSGYADVVHFDNL